MVKTCTSCNKEVLDDYTEFKCPHCGKTNIIRCQHCRELAGKYVCTNCHTEGP